jgi:acyl dehydratase
VSEQGRITPEAVAMMKERIGAVRPSRLPRGPFNREAHADTIRHFAYGVGDENPLWCEPEYAGRTRWGSVIGPPRYVSTLAFEETPADLRLVPKGDPLRGMPALFASVEWEFVRPVVPGDSVRVVAVIGDVEALERTADGRAGVAVTYAFRYRNQRDEPLAVCRERYVHRDRAAAPQGAAERQPAQRYAYSPAELQAVDAQYDKERRRGSEPRYWEDVAVGDEVDARVKGPLSTSDVLGYCVGTTFGGFGTAPHRLGYLNRRRIPAFYRPDDFGVPLSAWLCHIDEGVARRDGASIPYDFGAMRESWLYHMLTDWMGDDGFLASTHVEFRRQNYMGDVQWCRGRVTGKRLVEARAEVDVALECVNQRGERTTAGSAVVLLPSRQHGPVAIPAAPAGT